MHDAPLPRAYEFFCVRARLDCARASLRVFLILQPTCCKLQAYEKAYEKPSALNAVPRIHTEAGLSPAAHPLTNAQQMPFRASPARRLHSNREAQHREVAWHQSTGQFSRRNSPPWRYRHPEPQ
jgi:hypothetical protein